MKIINSVKSGKRVTKTQCLEFVTSFRLYCVIRVTPARHCPLQRKDNL